jgi:hypothetical protein
MQFFFLNITYKTDLEVSSVRFQNQVMIKKQEINLNLSVGEGGGGGGVKWPNKILQHDLK